MKTSSRFAIALIFGTLAGSLWFFAGSHGQSTQALVLHGAEIPRAELNEAASPKSGKQLAPASNFVSLHLITHRTPFLHALATPPAQPAAEPGELVALNPSPSIANEPTRQPDPPLGATAKSADISPQAPSLQQPSEKISAATSTIVAFGAGLDRLPRWFGSAKSEIRPVPYLDLNWHDQIELSTVKGLIIDAIHGEHWHGGLVGTMVWGRSQRELGKVVAPTLQNTVQGGLYLEYAMTPQATLGMRLRHDLQNTGVYYGDIYAELDLPKIGYLEHDLRVYVEGMNQRGMQRFFGLPASSAGALGLAEYKPGGGLSKRAMTYEAFMPTSTSTGIVLAASLGRLAGGAGNSPLVQNFGAATQKEVVAAFIYHFQ